MPAREIHRYRHSIGLILDLIEIHPQLSRFSGENCKKPLVILRL